jgi:roadblock/LC7 domain-containing protein
MIGLEKLMQRDGVIAAGQFTHDGRVVRAQGNLSEEEMESVARTCAVHERNSWSAATDLREETHLEWGSLNGWVLWAGRLALCVSGTTGVFVDTSKADFNQLLADLSALGSGYHPRLDPSEE